MEGIGRGREKGGKGRGGEGICQTNVKLCAWRRAGNGRVRGDGRQGRKGEVGAHSLSLLSNLSPVYNLHPLNLLTHYLFIIISV